jgi:integrase
MILKEARKRGYVRTNPMEFVEMPQTKATKKPILEEWEIRELMEAIPGERDKLIVLVASRCALVASELFGLVWECVFPDKLRIRSTAWNGELREWRVKRKARMREVPITPLIYRALMRWKSISKKTRAEDLVFPGQGMRKKRAYTGPACMRPSTFLHFQVQPIAKKLGITTPVTFQVLRRTAITHNQEHLKDMQLIAGHSDPGTTAGIYAQGVTKTARKVMEDYDRRIRRAKRPKAVIPAIVEAKPITRRVQ